MKDYSKRDDNCLLNLSKEEKQEYANWLINHPKYLKKFFRDTEALIDQQIKAIDNF